jgi:hypothetical protein
MFTKIVTLKISNEKQFYMAFHSPLNAFLFDISLIEIGQEIKLLEHFKKNWITLCIQAV